MNVKSYVKRLEITKILQALNLRTHTQWKYNAVRKIINKFTDEKKISMSLKRKKQPTEQHEEYSPISINIYIYI